MKTSNTSTSTHPSLSEYIKSNKRDYEFYKKSDENLKKLNIWRRNQFCCAFLITIPYFAMTMTTISSIHQILAIVLGITGALLISFAADLELVNNTSITNEIKQKLKNSLQLLLKHNQMCQRDELILTHIIKLQTDCEYLKKDAKSLLAHIKNKYNYTVGFIESIGEKKYDADAEDGISINTDIKFGSETKTENNKSNATANISKVNKINQSLKDNKNYSLNNKHLVYFKK